MRGQIKFSLIETNKEGSGQTAKMEEWWNGGEGWLVRKHNRKQGWLADYEQATSVASMKALQPKSKVFGAVRKNQLYWVADKPGESQSNQPTREITQNRDESDRPPQVSRAGRNIKWTVKIRTMQNPRRGKKSLNRDNVRSTPELPGNQGRSTQSSHKEIEEIEDEEASCSTSGSGNDQVGADSGRKSEEPPLIRACKARPSRLGSTRPELPALRLRQRSTSSRRSPASLADSNIAARPPKDPG